MISSLVPFDNSALQAVDDVQTAGKENDDDLLQILQKISELAKVSEDPPHPKPIRQKAPMLKMSKWRVLFRCQRPLKWIWTIS
jgi:hypothetical protein